MSGSWARDRLADVKVNGAGGVKRVLHDLWAAGLGKGLEAVGKGDGENIYEEDWDVLLILDACRVDLMAGVADQFEFCSELTTKRSVGSESKEWMEKTFVETYSEKIADTAYVTANPHSEEIINNGDFELVDEVWNYAWDHQISTVHARPVTDRLISVARERDPEFLIGHYMQPHAAFIPNPELGEHNDEFENSIWRSILRGRVSKEAIWDAYRDNLIYVLQEVEILLQNIDAETVVITADHGNAIGEWGIYGHPKTPIRVIREVPWIETTATDSGSHRPEAHHDTDIDYSVEERLADLGYAPS